MSLQFFPPRGTVLICNYETGFVPPEMVKKRRVVVLAEGDPGRNLSSRIILVAPLSTTPPEVERLFHVRIEAGVYSFLHPTAPVWVKADMLSHVGLARLDRIYAEKEGRYWKGSETCLSDADLKRIQHAVLHALGLAQESPVP
jgi:uncharacterized protein YifN (PemK superfamily)